MTSEIALLNKHAIALAADSATTVTYWEKGVRRQRYFKGANKIFNISNVHPVGLMTYDSANLQGVPWEVLVKAYRRHLGSKSHDHLSGYVSDFFEYVCNNAHIFPQRLMEQQFLSQIDRSTAIVIVPIQKRSRFGDARIDVFCRTEYTKGRSRKSSIYKWS
jgi:hypothetical protein